MKILSPDWLVVAIRKNILLAVGVPSPVSAVQESGASFRFNYSNGNHSSIALAANFEIRTSTESKLLVLVGHISYW